MRIAVLHPSSASPTSAFRDLVPVCVPARYVPGHSYHDFTLSKTTVMHQLIEIARGGFDVAINLCDGMWDDDEPGIEVVLALERLGVAFTGASSDFCDPSRLAMKMACHAAGIRFPAYSIVRDAGDVASALATLRLPLIVKHPNSYASVGMTRDSRVVDAPSLRRECARTVEAYGAALVEEFIEGQEFTVLVAEPRAGERAPWVFRPVQYTFPPGESFKHFDLKWRNFGGLETRPVEDAALDARLRDAAAKTFSSLSGSGFGRCDIRMDAAGDLYVLEINPNCAVFYPEEHCASADLILANDPAGHRGFLNHLLECGIRRRDRTLGCWEMRFDRAHGFGMYATRVIRAGDLVDAHEARPHLLISRNHAERDWDGLRRRWVGQYGWQLTDQVCVAWSGNPGEWRSMNHSCDANTLLDGLNIVARRDIAPGERITIDYSTLCWPGMEAVECHCGAPSCRGVIGAKDRLLLASPVNRADSLSG